MDEHVEKVNISEMHKVPTLTEPYEKDAISESYVKPTICEPYDMRILWGQSFFITALHVAAIYGLYVATFYAKWQTNLYSFLVYLAGAMGVTAGTHRYFAHRSYEAKRPLQLLYILLQTLTTQNDVTWWARIHRSHHKFSDTDADRHNINRGFFFAHMGWLMVSTHPEASRAIKTIDCSDLYADPALRFQRKFFYGLWLAIHGVLGLIPVLLWKETGGNVFCVLIAVRIVIGWHITFSINSFAHTLGNKPYDSKISANENHILNVIGLGEGFHNYHHTFPWDYRTSEFGLGTFCVTNVFIEMCRRFGWIYNVKQASKEMIMNRTMRTGDGSHSMFKNEDSMIKED